MLPLSLLTTMLLCRDEKATDREGLGILVPRESFSPDSLFAGESRPGFSASGHLSLTQLEWKLMASNKLAR